MSNNDSHSAPHPPHVDTSWEADLPSRGADVRLVGAPSSEAPEKPTRSRSAGKFLGGVHNVGLALLRLEQVSRSQKGDASPNLLLESSSGSVLHLHAWKPEWWPAAPEEEPEN